MLDGDCSSVKLAIGSADPPKLEETLEPQLVGKREKRGNWAPIASLSTPYLWTIGSTGGLPRYLVVDNFIRIERDTRTSSEHACISRRVPALLTPESTSKDAYPTS